MSRDSKRVQEKVRTGGIIYSGERKKDKNKRRTGWNHAESSQWKALCSETRKKDVKREREDHPGKYKRGHTCARLCEFASSRHLLHFMKPVWLINTRTCFLKFSLGLWINTISQRKQCCLDLSGVPTPHFVQHYTTKLITAALHADTVYSLWAFCSIFRHNFIGLNANVNGKPGETE